MLAATRNLLFWRYQEVIGSHSCTTAFELTIFPAAAGVILVALLGESKSSENCSPSQRDRLYQGVSISCVGERALAQLLSRVVGALVGHKTGWSRVDALFQVLTPRATIIARELCEVEQFPYHFS